MLSFANVFVQRYPESAALYSRIVAGLPSMLGGAGNESMPDQVGFLTAQQQKDHYNACRAYLYSSGTTVPYTLNFIEALMSGMPMVATDFPPTHLFYEIPALLGDGAGIVATTVEDAHAALKRLLDDDAFAQETSARARARAIELFSTDHIGAQWNALFDRVRQAA